MAPARDGLHSLGATFSADDTALDVRDADHAHNLSMLKQMSQQLQPDTTTLAGRSALRCSTPDYLPLAGMMLEVGKMRGIPAHLASQTDLPWLDGLYVNTGHGSKGMVTAPLCGEIIAATINHEIMPVDHGLLRALDPNRFLLRAQGLKKLTGSRFS
jgi:tRNA 5-methylaminomethyl-2-thiouridine biosynthesis bifunctional protein